MLYLPLLFLLFQHKVTPTHRDAILVELRQDINNFNPDRFIYPRDERTESKLHLHTRKMHPQRRECRKGGRQGGREREREREREKSENLILPSSSLPSE